MLATDKYGKIRVRVGDPTAAVFADDVNPRTGKVYRPGAFAPSIDELASDTYLAAQDASVLPSNIPIFDENGNIDNNKIEVWNPNTDLLGYNITISPQIPKVVAALCVSTIKQLGKIDYLNYITFDDTREIDFVATRVSKAGRKFLGGLVIGHKCNEYVSKPVVKRIMGKTYGLSIVSYLIEHSIGHLLYSKMVYDGKLDMVGKFLDVSGWTKDSESSISSSYMGVRNNSAWKRKTNNYPTEASKWGPQDDFSETFVLYLNHPEYLKDKYNEKYEIMSDIIEGKYVL